MAKFKLGDKVKLVRAEDYLTNDLETTGTVVPHPWRQSKDWFAVQVKSGAIPYGIQKNDDRWALIIEDWDA